MNSARDNLMPVLRVRLMLVGGVLAYSTRPLPILATTEAVSSFEPSSTTIIRLGGAVWRSALDNAAEMVFMPSRTGMITSTVPRNAASVRRSQFGFTRSMQWSSWLDTDQKRALSKTPCRHYRHGPDLG